MSTRGMPSLGDTATSMKRTMKGTLATSLSGMLLSPEEYVVGSQSPVSSFMRSDFSFTRCCPRAGARELRLIERAPHRGRYVEGRGQQRVTPGGGEQTHVHERLPVDRLEVDGEDLLGLETLGDQRVP